MLPRSATRSKHVNWRRSTPGPPSYVRLDTSADRTIDSARSESGAQQKAIVAARNGRAAGRDVRSEAGGAVEKGAGRALAARVPAFETVPPEGATLGTMS